MDHSSLRTRTSHRLTSPRGAWVTLGGAALVILMLFLVVGGATAPARVGQAPAGAESTRVEELMERFPGADQQAVLVVASREDDAELSDEDVDAIAQLAPSLSDHVTGEPTGPIVSEDRRAALVSAPITIGADNTETATIINDLRSDIADLAPTGLTLQVTGGPAFGAEIANAFEGADVTLLLVTILVVAVLLIITYRSPVLWLIPLLVIALADGLAGRVAAAAGSLWGLEFDAGIVSVLVFGAGTNYALLLISRYREELQRTEDDRAALGAAWRGTVDAILASNITVVLSLSVLLFAAMPMTRGLGVPAALGLLIVLAAVLIVLPPVLAICGRKVFWPFIPRPQHAPTQGRRWRAVAAHVSARPIRSLLAGFTLLAVMAAGLLGTSVGLGQLEKFRVESESAAGFETLAAHFPPGEAQPIWIVANTDSAENVVSAVVQVDGIIRAHPAGQADGLTRIMAVSEHSPGSEQSLDQITTLRETVGSMEGADALVGGAVAIDLDARAASAADLLLIGPLVLAVSFIVLLILLRSIVAPVLLLVVNVASAAAAIGAGAWLSRVVFDQQALDVQVPILAFLFLIALGIDYTIFLVHRARAEAALLGTRAGMVEAVAHTGGVITSAGIVLAAVFAALGVLPLVTLGQLGLIVGIGVLVDTLVVRTVIVPAIFSLVGDRIWWSGKPNAHQGESTHESHRHAAHAH